ncbi:MAG: acyltransferase [Rudaea sp.]
MKTKFTQTEPGRMTAAMPQPSWDVTNRHSFAWGFRMLAGKIGQAIQYYVLCRGNKVGYLRRLGVRIGEDCEILTGASNLGTEPWLVQIENRVTITQGVVFLTHDGANRLFRHRVPGSSKWGNRFGAIRVRCNSFIGANSILMPGVSIGPNSIVGVGSVVNKDVPADTVVAGVPARPICTLDEYIDRYGSKMIPIQAETRMDLRRELTRRFWGEER